jgi:hypothetical protein
LQLQQVRHKLRPSTKLQSGYPLNVLKSDTPVAAGLTNQWDQRI